MKLVLTCEHGGNTIPVSFKKYFENSAADLASHRGYDPGAWGLFKKLSALADAAHYSLTSRLLVELNRSLHSKQLFSKYSKMISPQEKKQILNDFYFPYRLKVQDDIQKFISE